MIKISIIKNSQVTNQASFPSQEEAQAWLASHEGMGTFGQNRQVISHPAISTESQVEISPAVIDENGVEISPAQFETQVTETPAREEVIEGYVVEIVDISAQLEQEAINAAALKLLAESDWMILRELDSKVACPQEVKDARAAARASIVR
jgi:hypothetical protein